MVKLHCCFLQELLNNACIIPYEHLHNLNCSMIICTYFSGSILSPITNSLTSVVAGMRCYFAFRKTSSLSLHSLLTINVCIIIFSKNCEFTIISICTWLHSKNRFTKIPIKICLLLLLIILPIIIEIIKIIFCKKFVIWTAPVIWVKIV